MNSRIALIATTLCLSGCSVLNQPGGLLYHSGLEKKLARAVTLIEQRNHSAATDLLSEIGAEPGVEGVTDEALFRLGLLHLGSEDRNHIARSRQALARLKELYPASSWTYLAASITDTLTIADDHRQQLRKVKELNLSLVRENKDLRLTIERVKILELELGKGSKR